MTVVKFGSN